MIGKLFDRKDYGERKATDTIPVFGVDCLEGKELITRHIPKLR